MYWRTGLVKSRPLDQWKETLALLCAYGEDGEFHALCDMLAKRLAGAGLLGPATLAWICAANVDKAVRQWTSDLKASSPEPSAEALQVNTCVHRLSLTLASCRAPRYC